MEGPLESGIAQREFFQQRPRSPSFRIPTPWQSSNGPFSPSQYAKSTDPRFENGPAISRSIFDRAPRPKQLARRKTSSSAEQYVLSLPNSCPTVAGSHPRSLPPATISVTGRTPILPSSHVHRWRNRPTGISVPKVQLNHILCWTSSEEAVFKPRYEGATAYEETTEHWPSGVRMLDTCSVWKGLSGESAGILRKFAQNLPKCLVTQLTQQLRQLDPAEEQMLEENSPSSGSSYPLQVDLGVLLNDLLESLTTGQWQPSIASEWDQDDRWAFAELFLKSCDCVQALDHSSNATIRGRLILASNPDFASLAPIISVEPRPARLSLQAFRKDLFEGEEQIIVPRWTLGAEFETRATSSLVSYYLRPHPEWLHWDGDLEGFCGSAETTIPGRPDLVELELHAIVETLLPPYRVCFQKTLRLQIRFMILPATNGFVAGRSGGLLLGPTFTLPIRTRAEQEVALMESRWSSSSSTCRSPSSAERDRNENHRASAPSPRSDALGRISPRDSVLDADSDVMISEEDDRSEHGFARSRQGLDTITAAVDHVTASSSQRLMPYVNDGLDPNLWACVGRVPSPEHPASVMTRMSQLSTESSVESSFRDVSAQSSNSQLSRSSYQTLDAEDFGSWLFHNRFAPLQDISETEELTAERSQSSIRMLSDASEDTAIDECELSRRESIRSTSVNPAEAAFHHDTSTSAMQVDTTSHPDSQSLELLAADTSCSMASASSSLSIITTHRSLSPLRSQAECWHQLTQTQHSPVQRSPIQHSSATTRFADHCESCS